jgi:hypothetical protein
VLLYCKISEVSKITIEAENLDNSFRHFPAILKVVPTKKILINECKFNQKKEEIMKPKFAPQAVDMSFKSWRC